MNRNDAFRDAANTVVREIDRGAGLTIKAIKGKGGLPVGLIVACALRPDQVVELNGMIVRWAQGQKLNKAMLDVRM